MGIPSKHVVISINTTWNVFNFRSGLIRALQDNGFRVTALSPPDEFCEPLKSIGCDHVALKMDNKGTSPIKDLQLLLRYRKILGDLKPDIFLGFTIKPNIYGSLAAQSLAIPVINNVSGLGTAFIRRSWLTTLVEILYRRAFKRSHTVFFQNRDDRSLFLRRQIVDPNKCRMLPGSGINLDHYKPVPNAESRHNNAPVFLLIARLLWDKGIREYAEAAKIVRQTHPRAKFQLLGFLDVENRTAVDRASVDQWVSEGAIEYLGTSTDVRREIANADCVVLPSYREGLPRTLLEAAAMGKPLIATEVPGCRDVVSDGENGFLCKPRDPRDLADAVSRFIHLDTSERQRMGNRSREMVESGYDEQIVIARYLDAIHSAGQFEN